MFRQIAVIFLLFAFSAQVFNRALIVLDYYANKAAFTKNCENIARPKLHCEGRCQMVKMIRENERKEQQIPDKVWNIISEVVSSRSFFYTLSLTEINIQHSYSIYYTVSFPKGVHSSIFHPPGLV